MYRFSLKTQSTLAICRVEIIKQHFALRRKIKIALFPLTQGRVVRSGKIFLFFVYFFSFLKMGIKCNNTLQLIISS